MSHLDLQEQEQLNKMKYFWKDWGRYISGLVVVILIAYLSNLFWTTHVQKKAEDASVLYAQFLNAVDSGQNNSAYSIAKSLEFSYPRIEYTALASIWAAKVADEQKNYKLSSMFLLWTINNSKDSGLVSLAKLRLADVYIDQGKTDKALDLLMSKHESTFDALYYAKRGDLYVVRGDLDKARSAYKEAIQKAGEDSNISQMVQLKLDVIGGN